MFTKTSGGTGFQSIAWFLLQVTVALLTALFIVYGAKAEDSGASAIDALAYDRIAGQLLKSDGTELYSSPDDGRTWRPLAGELPADGNVSSIAVGAGERPMYYVAGSGLGVLRWSSNDGRWTQVGAGLPSANVVALAAHSTQPDTLYAYVPENGIYRTKDAGQSWKLMDKGPDGIQQLIHTNMAGSMESGWLYAATTEGIRFSMDCFCLWREGGGIAGLMGAVAVDPGQPDRLFAAWADGIVQSVNGGQDWTEVAASPPEPVSALVVSPSGQLYAGTSGGRLFKGNGGATWEQVSE